VPRFYFDLFNDMATIDHEGLELADEAVAHKQAWTAAAQLIADQLMAGHKLNPRHRIEVRDDHDRTIYILHFGDLVEPEGASE